MKILLTGACGKLGQITGDFLREQGWDVLGTDIRGGGHVRPADLCDFAACQELMAGMGAVVHLGNLSHQAMATPSEGYRRNTVCNFNVFQAAVEAGVRKIVFASSIQVYGMDAVFGSERAQLPPYFPIDAETPLRPRNWYGLSKKVSEEALAYFAAEHPQLQAVSIRFPRLVDFQDPGQVEWFRENHLEDVWRVLGWGEAAELIEACLSSDLPGYRNYLPAYPGTVLGMSPRRVAREYFPSVPLKCAWEELRTLIAIEEITRETGWLPSPPAWRPIPQGTAIPVPP